MVLYASWLSGQDDMLCVWSRLRKFSYPQACNQRGGGGEGWLSSWRLHVAHTCSSCRSTSSCSRVSALLLCCCEIKVLEVFGVPSLVTVIMSIITFVTTCMCFPAAWGLAPLQRSFIKHCFKV